MRKEYKLDLFSAESLLKKMIQPSKIYNAIQYESFDTDDSMKDINLQNFKSDSESDELEVNTLSKQKLSKILSE